MAAVKSLNARVVVWWQGLRDSLWFIPAVMMAGSVVLAIVLIELSSIVGREALREYPRFFGASAESSRSMLATIAGAMITVAAVTFSITMLAVTQASSQYSPRILRNFMRDRPSQLALGTLTGVFVYCLVVLRTIRGDGELQFIPSLAVLGGIVLAIASLGVLIFFIHHIASSLQASRILDRIQHETIASVQKLFPDELGAEAEVADPEAAAAYERVRDSKGWMTIQARRTGYLTHVDSEGLLAFARESRSIVRMERAIGDYVIRGTPLCAVLGTFVSDVEGKLNSLFAVAINRTVEQDAAFGIRQIVDMAVKALSPGINDTTTAVHCVDNLGAILVCVATRRVENRLRMSEGKLRVIAQGPTFASLLDGAVQEIRRAAADNVTVLVRLLEVLHEVSRCARNPARRELLRKRAEQIVETSERSVADPMDRSLVRTTRQLHQG